MKTSRMRSITTTLLLLCATARALASANVAPLAESSGPSVQSLVTRLLATDGGIGVVAGSAQYVGAVAAAGTFNSGGLGISGLGIDQGVVLTTGDARFIGSSAAFPGDDSNKSDTFTSGIDNSLTVNNAPGNALFKAITSAATNNASILSFQFVPSGSTARLSMVFGSEDYNDLVNSGFPTDVFGIFVNGVNYALVPGTDTSISAATVNCGGPTSGFAPGNGGRNCGLYRDNPSFSNAIDTELDGLTTLITLSLPVRAGAVNSISIGIADTLDSAGDSALLLQAGSFAVAAVPEPATYALLAIGLSLTGIVARRRQRRGGA